MRILVIHGPNLNLLGMREPEVYGSTTLSELDHEIALWAGQMEVEVEIEQSNSEGRIVELVQTFDGDGIVMNPGAFTHTSRSIADAIAAVRIPVVETHISNIREREPWRARSVVAPVCVRTIFGRGVSGYRDAMRHIVNRAAMPFETIRYGPHEDNVGDLRRGGSDLVVLAHGGLWRHEYARDGTESLAVDLTSRGYTTWNIEYRRVGSGGGWPASAHDVLTALDTVPQLDVGAERVLVVGHSAGAQLLMWAGPRSRTGIELHVALGPLLDLRAVVDNDDVGAADASGLLDQGAPPIVAPGGIETLIVHGVADQIVPVERSIAYADRYEVEHHRTESDHFSLLDPTKPEWSWVVGRIEGRRVASTPSAATGETG